MFSGARVERLDDFFVAPAVEGHHFPGRNHRAAEPRSDGRAPENSRGRFGPDGFRECFGGDSIAGRTQKLRPIRSAEPAGEQQRSGKEDKDAHDLIRAYPQEALFYTLSFTLSSPPDFWPQSTKTLDKVWDKVLFLGQAL